MKSEETIEKRLREEQLRALPGDWREEILGTALGASRSATREALVALFPRPLMIGLAAAWMFIVVLRLSLPVDGSSKAVMEEGSADVDLVVLAERVRVNVTGELEWNGDL